MIVSHSKKLAPLSSIVYRPGSELTPARIRRFAAKCLSCYVRLGPRLLHRWLAVATLALLTTIAALPVHADDTVVLASRDNPGESLRVTGTIVDYTGKALRIRPTSGVEQTYPASRVLDIESTWTTEQTRGDQALAAGEYSQAVAAYRQAMQTESRTWAKRKILAQLIWAYRSQGNIEAACETFLLLYDSDPTTPYLDAIPLAWSPGNRVARLKAEQWMGDTQRPAAMLLGASHLMSTDARDSALAALGRLRAAGDPGMVALAAAQRWRADAFRANPQQVDSWVRQIERMPAALRGGPYFLLGRVRQRQQQTNAAALAYLRVPVLFPQDHRQAATALLAAGDVLAADSRREEAAILYREIQQRFADTPARQDAVRRLAEMTESGTR